MVLSGLMWDLPDPEYIARLFKAWPRDWPPARLSLREGSSLSMEPAGSNRTEVESLREQLRDYINEAKSSEAEIIKEIGIPKKTFYDFLYAKTVPQGKTISAIRDFLKGKGKTAT